jgi:thiol-disulfide isomerase/thioredoxin
VRIKTRRTRIAAVALVTVTASLLAAGCGGPVTPKLMVFLGKSSKSYSTTKPIVEQVEKKYRGKIVFENIDYDNPSNKGIIKKYSVTMNPTFLMFNAEGEIREQYLGSVDEETLASVVQSYVPVPGAAKSAKAPSIPKNLQY